MDQVHLMLDLGLLKINFGFEFFLFIGTARGCNPAGHYPNPYRQNYPLLNLTLTYKGSMLLLEAQLLSN